MIQADLRAFHRRQTVEELCSDPRVRTERVDPQRDHRRLRDLIQELEGQERT